MGQPEIEHFHRLTRLTQRVARASADLQAALHELDDLPPSQAEELEALAERLLALHLLVANETERAWNAAEADARRARRAELMGRVHDAMTAETTVPNFERGLWTELEPAPPDDAPDAPSPR